MMIEEVIANIEDYSLWDYKGYRICKEEAETIVEALKELKRYRKLTTYLVEEGQSNYKKYGFKLGDLIKFTPSQVEEIVNKSIRERSGEH